MKVKMKLLVVLAFSVLLVCVNSKVPLSASLRSMLSKLRTKTSSRAPFIVNTFKRIRPFRMKESITCRIFGFENAEKTFVNGLFNRNDLSSHFQVEFGDLQIQVFPSRSPGDMHAFQDDVYIGYVQSGEVAAQNPHLVANIHSILEGALSTNSSARLILMVARSSSAVVAGNDEEKALQSLVKVIARASLSTRPHRMSSTPVPPVQLHIVRANTDRDPYGKSTRKVLRGIFLNIVATQLRKIPDVPLYVAPYAQVARKAWNWLRFQLYPVMQVTTTICHIPDVLNASPSLPEIFTLHDARHLQLIDMLSFQLLQNVSVALFDTYQAHRAALDIAPQRINVSDELAHIHSALRDALTNAQLFVPLQAEQGNSRRSPLGFLLSSRSAEEVVDMQLPSIPAALYGGMQAMLKSLFSMIVSSYERSAAVFINEKIAYLMNETKDSPVPVDPATVSVLRQELLSDIEKDLSKLRKGFMDLLGYPPGIQEASPVFYSVFKHVSHRASDRNNFLTHHAYDRLCAQVQHSLEECKHKMILDGTYNPYARTGSRFFPPLSIGVQCAVHPADVLSRATALWSANERHFDGVCDKRADHIPVKQLDDVQHRTKWNLKQGDSKGWVARSLPWWRRSISSVEKKKWNTRSGND